jgi:tetratricopeptide (TPR) repeat protein
MQRTGISPSRYLELYTQSWKDLQQYSRPHQSYSNGSLVGTWMISYQEIQKNYPAAAKLLFLLACYDNQDIWYDLIREGLQGEHRPSWLLEVASHEIDFSHAIQALMSFSLIQAKHSSSSYSLHSVVQDWCIGYMQEEDIKVEMWAIAMISIGYSVPNSDEPRYWTLQQRLLPHADHVFQMIQDMELASADSIILGTINNLGNLYSDQGKLWEAKQMYQRALAGYEKTLGADHTLTLGTVNNIGLLYADQGKLQEAEQMYQRALAGYKKALGADHTSTLYTVNNLGLLYADQGKLQEAEQMYQRALADSEKTLGADHMSTLDIVNNIGLLYADQGKLQEAEQMYQRALAGYKKTLGADHTSTLRTVNNLGNLYADQEKLQEAEQMYQ